MLLDGEEKARIKRRNRRVWVRGWKIRSAVKFECEIWLAEHWNLHHTIARNAADGGYTKKFVARNVAEVGRDSTAAILRATNFGVDTRCNSAIARNIARNFAPCIRTLIQLWIMKMALPSWFMTCCLMALLVVCSIFWILQKRTTSLQPNWKKTKRGFFQCFTW